MHSICHSIYVCAMIYRQDREAALAFGKHLYNIPCLIPVLSGKSSLVVGRYGS